MRALVTGSSGFIGSNLADRLTRLGHEVVGIDRRSRPDAPYRHITADLNDPRFSPVLTTAAQWADVVFHLAARPGIRTGPPGIEELRRRDIVTATMRVLEAVTPDTHLIVTSSSAVYGGARPAPGGLRPSREDDPLDPRGGYARCKVEMEMICQQWAERSGRLALVRPFTVIGERQRDDMAVSLWLDAASRGEPVTVIGSLHRTRDVTDVHKVVAGIIRVAELRFAGVLNLGAGRPRTLSEMLEAVFRAVGREVPITTQQAPMQEVQATYADNTRSNKLGIELGTDLDEAVARQHAVRLGRQPRLVTA